MHLLSAVRRCCYRPLSGVPGVHCGPDAGAISLLRRRFILSVVGPVIYTVWMRGRPLADLGLTQRTGDRRSVKDLVPFRRCCCTATTTCRRLLSGCHSSPCRRWSASSGRSSSEALSKPALNTGFGPIPGVVAAAAPCTASATAWGTRNGFPLCGLGLVYGIAYACVSNVLVLWPVLIPLVLSTTTDGGSAAWAAIRD